MTPESPLSRTELANSAHCAARNPDRIEEIRPGRALERLSGPQPAAAPVRDGRAEKGVVERRVIGFPSDASRTVQAQCAAVVDHAGARVGVSISSMGPIPLMERGNELRFEERTCSLPPRVVSDRVRQATPFARLAGPRRTNCPLELHASKGFWFWADLPDPVGFGLAFRAG